MSVRTSLAVIRKYRDVAKRRHLPPGAIHDQDQWLGRLFSAWESQRSGGMLPRRSAFDPIELMKLSRGCLHIVDTPVSGPLDYRFRLWGPLIDFDCGADYCDRWIADMPHTTMRKAEDYSDAVGSGVACYQLICSVQNARKHTYSRLLLPLTVDGRRVTQLLVCINQRPIAEFDDEADAAERSHLWLVQS